jgi:hypothetical protein
MEDRASRATPSAAGIFIGLVIEPSRANFGAPKRHSLGKLPEPESTLDFL